MRGGAPRDSDAYEGDTAPHGREEAPPQKALPAPR